MNDVSPWPYRWQEGYHEPWGINQEHSQKVHSAALPMSVSWWRHQIKTPLLALYAENSPVSDAELWCLLWSGLNKRLSKHSWHRWFETPSLSFWRHCNIMTKLPSQKNVYGRKGHIPTMCFYPYVNLMYPLYQICCDWVSLWSTLFAECHSFYHGQQSEEPVRTVVH